MAATGIALQTAVIRVKLKEKREIAFTPVRFNRGALGPIHVSWDHLGTRTRRFVVSLDRLSSVRATESSGFMERAMGIEPTFAHGELQLHILLGGFLNRSCGVYEEGFIRL